MQVWQAKHNHNHRRLQQTVCTALEDQSSYSIKISNLCGRHAQSQALTHLQPVTQRSKIGTQLSDSLRALVLSLAVSHTRQDICATVFVSTEKPRLEAQLN